MNKFKSKLTLLCFAFIPVCLTQCVQSEDVNAEVDSASETKTTRAVFGPCPDYSHIGDVDCPEWLKDYPVRLFAAESIGSSCFNEMKIQGYESEGEFQFIYNSAAERFVDAYPDTEPIVLPISKSNNIELLYDVPEDWYNIISEAYMSDDFDDFDEVRTQFNEWAVSSDIGITKTDLKIINYELEYRDMYIRTISNSGCYKSTRMSPGDRMIWRNCISQMSEEQRKDFIKVNVSGLLGCFGGSVMGFVKSGWGFICGIW